MKIFGFLFQKNKKRDDILLSCALSYIFINWLLYSFQLLNREELLFFYHFLLIPIIVYAMTLNISVIKKNGIGRSAERISRNITISVALLCAILNYRLYPVLSSAIFLFWFGLAVISLRIALTRNIPDGVCIVKMVIMRLNIILGTQHGSIPRERLRRLRNLCLTYIFGTGFSIYSEIQPNAVVAPTDDSLVKTYFDNLKQLNDPQFHQLCADDKLNVMQCVANIEATIKGLSVAPTIVSFFLPLDIGWWYAHEIRTIAIDIDSLDADARKCMNVVLQGVYHSVLCERYLYNFIWQGDPTIRGLKAEYEGNLEEYKKHGDLCYLRTFEENTSKHVKKRVDEYFDRLKEIQKTAI